MAVLGSNAIRDMIEIQKLVSRRARLVRRLKEYDFISVATPLAGLLTRVENHTATTRIEALIHLAAYVCRGKRKPRQRQIREWLNFEIFADPITKFEVPVEDVFVSNVDLWFGNARLFDGRRQNNADYVRLCVETLQRISDRAWVTRTLCSVEALMRLSEAIAERLRIPRYTRTQSTPREKIDVEDLSLKESSARVTFSDEELAVIGVEPSLLIPFFVQSEHTNLLSGQSLGNTAIERRPLVRCNGTTAVYLPTAIGEAIRRIAIESAIEAGDLLEFQSTLHLAQFSEIFMLGRADWEIEFIEMLKPDPADGMREFVGKFDEQGYVHVVFVPDQFKSVANEGLSSIHELTAGVRDRIHRRVAEIINRHPAQRGLTLLVHGGIGRDFSPVWGDLPDGWHQVCISAPDFMLLANTTDFSALRAWKLLQQIDNLKKQGVICANLHGFLNLVAFAYQAGFELVPERIEQNVFYIHSDFILPMRHEVRTILDRHAVMSSNEEEYVSLQCQPLVAHFDKNSGRAILISPHHRTEWKMLACIELATCPVWIQCSHIPEQNWHHNIVLSILNLIFGWLSRTVPVLETQGTTLPKHPITFSIKFSELETFSQHITLANTTPTHPELKVRDREIVIDCIPLYLQTFLLPGNLGDRLMVSSLLRGFNSLCGDDKWSDAELEKLVQDVVPTHEASFLTLVPCLTPEDMIYDLVQLPKLRLLMPEDHEWSRLGLARRAGYKGKPRLVKKSQARGLLHDAVDAVWCRVRSRLLSLSRESLVERSLLNFVSVRKAHRDWLRYSSAYIVLNETTKAIDELNARVFQRDCSGVASRVIAEMALCTSPCDGGSRCTDTDLDFLIAEVSTLIECASQSDALRFNLANNPPVILQNGSFTFDVSVSQSTVPLMTEYWQRKYSEEQRGKEDNENTDTDEGADPDFPSAFNAEFGITPEQYQMFVYQMTLDAIERSEAHLKLQKSDVLHRLHEAGASNPCWTFESLALYPRCRWDERNPVNASARDWYPWRYARRLSIMRRPMVQLSVEDDPKVVVVPSILSETLNFLYQAAFGELPDTLFDSPEMIACVGRAADRNGHAFARKVAKCLKNLNWNTELEVRLTRFGGDASLGDVDVLSWHPESGVVLAIECKNLRYDRTVGEVGERLAEYSQGMHGDKPTQLQRHLNRMCFLESRRKSISDFTGIPFDRLRLRSGLVTATLVPMQIAGRVAEVLDFVTDYEMLEEEIRRLNCN